MIKLRIYKFPLLIQHSRSFHQTSSHWPRKKKKKKEEQQKYSGSRDHFNVEIN